MHKITIILEDDIFQFVDSQAKGNRSAYINAVLAEYRRCSLELQMITALQKDAQDCEYQAEIAVWDNVVGDGIV
ncbi:MAG: CopG family transcriptional regulator [Rivularia sp. (in: cyanobacteria)]